MFKYLSWAPELDDPTGLIPFQRVQGNGTDTYRQRLVQLGPQLKDSEDTFTRVLTPARSSVDGSPLSPFVAIFPNASKYEHYDIAVKNVDNVVQESTILRSSLHNASYQADLTYVNRNQTIHLTDRTVLNGISFVEGVANIEFDKASIYSNTTFIHRPQLMETLSYQSIMEAFDTLLVGSISTEMMVVINRKTDHNSTFSNTENRNTVIVSTSLMNTAEMRHILSQSISDPRSPFVSYWSGRSVNVTGDSPLPFSKALEELFQNTTFSLMSSKMF